MPMIPCVHGKTIAVMGLGRSGSSAARMLALSGATVWAWDDSERSRAEAKAHGIAVTDLAKADLSLAAFMVWSPGIPHTHPAPHPVAEAARKAGLPILCDIDLLALAAPRARYVGITGTNGKSTTTTLIAHILKNAGCKVVAGGNLGTPALDLPQLGAEGVYVLELSSYQTELLHSPCFDIGVLLNVTPDHLARHGGMQGYAAAKANLFAHLQAGGVPVIGVDDEPSRHILDSLPAGPRAQILPISTERSVEGGVFVQGGMLVDARNGGDGDTVLDLSRLAHLPGRHNGQNACAAYAVCSLLGLDRAQIRAGMESYPGLAHRQEQIAVIDGVRYINDSKATNADAAEKAIVCYDDIYWIAGGRPKEGGIASLEPHFSRIRRAFLIGEAAEAFAVTLDGKVPVEQCGTLNAALSAARRQALTDGIPGAVVLLSPACASWDQFTSFEARGDLFRALVSALPGKRSAP